MAQHRRRRLAPEVVQTSGMDCGPAALACLLRGHGIDASYGRLREACHTDVDGTSIDRLEDVAACLGLDAQQVMLAPDLLLQRGAPSLPAIVVTRLPSGFTHFVVAWRRHGRFVQLMDPAVGRRFVRADRLLAALYLHETELPAQRWSDHARSEAFLDGLRERLRRAGADGDRLVAAAVGQDGWEPLAALDAAARVVATLVGRGAVTGRRDGGRLVETLLERPELVPDRAWQVQPAGPGTVRVRGAVLVQVGGTRADLPAAPASRELRAALDEPPARPGRELVRLVCRDGRALPAALVALAVAGGAGVVAESVLLRTLLEPSETSRTAVLAVFALLTALAALEVPLVAGPLALGRRLEVSVRRALLAKVGRLPDAYVRSRPVSDMAERSHNLHRLRTVPDLAATTIRLAAVLALMTLGLMWLDPPSAALAAAAGVAAVAVPLAVQPVLQERDLRLRTHAGALSRFTFDALLGIVAVRAHRAEANLRREHARQVREWAATARAFQRAVVVGEAVGLTVGFGLAVVLISLAVPRLEDPADALLLVFWALGIPAVGHELGLALRQYPPLRTVTLRLVEPLGAVDDAVPAAPAGPAGRRAVTVELDDVTVVAAGQPVLRDVTVRLEAGSHTAVVGASGAGKSTLLGLLLGWHRCEQGEVRVDGEPLTPARIERLRQESAWVDPGVQLWNRSLRQNLRYGAHADDVPLADVVSSVGLERVVAGLPGGVDAVLGQGGGVLSGGEGQRVRVGRALHRRDARLVLLDEPFRGLERGTRAQLLRTVRDEWRAATVLCVTHDVAETVAFDRVIVIDGGRLVEDGAPTDLAALPGSRYRSLLEAEQAVRAQLADGTWRRVRLDAGRVDELCAEAL